MSLLWKLIEEMIELFRKSIPQIAWYLQIRDKIPKSFRLIDKMATWEIGEMYRQQFFFCDTCWNEYGYPINYSMEHHILHLINPKILWSCEECSDDDFKSGRVIGVAK
jgi:hypothetical protein